MNNKHISVTDNPSTNNEHNNRRFGEKSVPQLNLLVPLKKYNTIYNPIQTFEHLPPDNPLENNIMQNSDDTDQEPSEIISEDPNFTVLNSLLDHFNKQNNQLLKDKIDKKSKKLKIKYFTYSQNNKIQTFFINPRTFFKFFDYRFPYDSSFVKDDISENK